MTMPRPPRILERLIAWALPRAEDEFILGDLAEEYVEDRQRGSRARSILRYLWTGFAIAWHLRETRGSRAIQPRRGDGIVAAFIRDLHAAGKTLRHARGFTVTVVLITAVGIGATTAIFSVANPILFSPLPYAAPEHLVMVWERASDGSNNRTGYATFADLSREGRTLQSSAAIAGWQPTIATGDGDAERLRGQSVSWQFFEMLGLGPAIGRGFVQADDQPGEPRVAVLTHGLYQQRFGSDSSLVGKTILLDGRPYGVIGILPAGFDDVFQPGTQIYRTLSYAASQPWACRTCRHLRMVARIHPDVAVDAAATELNMLSTQLVAEYPTEYPAAGINLVPVHEEVTRQARPALMAVLIAAGFLLLIACANITNLQIARSVRRGNEFAVRVALGAGIPQLVRQLLAEGSLLALSGGVAGVLLAAGAITMLKPYLPEDLPRLGAVGLDISALIFSVGVTFAVGLLVGLAPLATARRAQTQAFRAGRSATRRSDVGRGAIVVGEVALALMLLTGTGLLGRSLLTLLAVDPGFEAERLLTLEIQSTGPNYGEDAAVWSYHDRVRDAVTAIPGVVAAAVSTQLPLGGNFDGNGIMAEDKPLDNPELAPGGQRYAVSPEYLSTMQIPILEGRNFTADDGPGNKSEQASDAGGGKAGVTILSASLARRIWGEESALGKRIRVGGPSRPWLTVVGIAGDVRHTGLDQTELHGFYVPERQWYWADNQVVLVVRTATRPLSLAPQIVQAVRDIDPSQPVMHLRPGDQLIATSTAQRRLALMLFAAFGIVAALLSAAGVYGVLAGAVAERRREIGIRTALGATPRAIVQWVLRQGMAMAVGGLVLGLVGSILLTRYLRAMLFGIEPTDPATLGGTALVVALVALGACLIPAWRALRVDPVTVLKAD